MKDNSIEKKIIGTTWSEVMADLDKATRKLGNDSKEKNSSEPDSSSNKT
jgi:hypothetical protein